MPSQTKRLSTPRLFQALYVAISDGTCRRRFAVHVTENAAGCSPWDRLGLAVDFRTKRQYVFDSRATSVLTY